MASNMSKGCLAIDSTPYTMAGASHDPLPPLSSSTLCAKLPFSSIQHTSAWPATPLSLHAPGPAQSLEWQTRSKVGAYIRMKPDPQSRSLAAVLRNGPETDEALLSVSNFGTYSRSEVETLGSVFLLFARCARLSSAQEAPVKTFYAKYSNSTVP